MIFDRLTCLEDEQVVVDERAPVRQTSGHEKIRLGNRVREMLLYEIKKKYFESYLFQVII